MIDFIKQESKKNIILFVHGFIGGEKTWIGDKNNPRLPEYLLANDHLSSNYDFALFNYFTKLTDKLEKVKWIVQLFNGGRKLKKNLSIQDISDILYSEIQVRLKDYEKVTIIAHSMGGLVSKACIIKSLERKQNQNINSYFSLAVPHNGSNLANLGKIILNNPHVKDLAPLEVFINEINTKWLCLDNLPHTTYYQGKADEIVPNTSSIGYESRPIEPIFTDDDHFSILKPESGESVVVKSMIDNIIASESKTQTKKIKKQSKEANLSLAQQYLKVEKVFGNIVRKAIEDKFKVFQDFRTEGNEIDLLLKSPLKFDKDFVFEVKYSTSRVGGRYFHQSLLQLKNSLDYYRQKMKSKADGRLVFIMPLKALTQKSMQYESLYDDTLSLIEKGNRENRSQGINICYLDYDKLETYSSDEIISILKL